MKKVLVFLCGILFFFGMVGGVQAVPIYVGEENPGWVGTAGGDPPVDNVSNYNFNLVNDIIDAWNDEYDGVPTPPASSSYPLFPLADNSYDYASGPNVDWTATGMNYQYLTIKYSGFVDLFYVDGLTSFDWTGSALSSEIQQGFSHARLWNGTPVPEPSTILLLGLGLVGLAGLGRKKIKS